MKWTEDIFLKYDRFENGNSTLSVSNHLWQKKSAVFFCLAKHSSEIYISIISSDNKIVLLLREANYIFKREHGFMTRVRI